MESLSSYYRPHDFSEVVCQKSIITVLERQLETGDFRNAYLFAGPSGCGKTTLARIFANKLNKNLGNAIEIDAASHNGVDSIREIVATANERAIDCEYKVIIVDECHVLSNQAWQAFLKCIEETPRYTVFIFCTTDPQKIPATILNRVQRFNLTKIPQNLIKQRLNYICENEGLTNYNESVEYISKVANGGMRDAISLLDKVSGAGKNLTIENTLSILGSFSYDILFDITSFILTTNQEQLIKCIEYVYSDGKDLTLLIDNYLTFILDIYKYIIFRDFSLINIPETFKDDIEYIINVSNNKNKFSKLLDEVLNVKNSLKTDTSIKTTIEVMFLNISRIIESV